MTKLSQLHLFIVFSIALVPMNGQAQETSAAHRHMGHVADGF